MSETLANVLGILLYGSGFLFWPIRRWVRRDKVRGKALGFAFIAQIISYIAVSCCAMFIRLGHFYYWFIILIELNILFTIAAVFALIRDVCFERRLEANHCR